MAWLSLDAEDSDLRRFLTHLVAAIRTSSPEVGGEALALLETDRGLPAEDVLVSLVNELDELAGPTVLALDDYHVIDARDVHEAVTFLLDHLPPRVTLAITTRADPPLPLGRLRARGELLELRAADLRFTPDEAGAFLNDVMGLNLEAAQVAALDARTEGWAAGLQLAALSARGRSDSGDANGVARFVEAFTGNHRFVLDYLVEEVLDRQPEEVRAFLLDTSVLDQLTGGLCDAVTERTGGQAMLETLERANLFVIPLDDERRWYRYHHLFADALRARLSARHPERVSQLHAAASRWLAENGLMEDAVRHAMAGGDQEHTADLVELAVADMRRRRANRTLRVWLAALPEDVVRRRPLLASGVAWYRLTEGDVDGAEALARRRRGRPRHGPRGTGPRVTRPRVTGPRVRIAGRGSQGPRGRDPLAPGHGRGVPSVGRPGARRRRRHRCARPPSTRARGPGGPRRAQWGLRLPRPGGLGRRRRPRPRWTPSPRRSRACRRRAWSRMRWAARSRSPACGWRAKGPAEASRLYERALATADRHPGPVLASTGDLHVGLADVLREQGDLDGAEEHLELARALGDRGVAAGEPAPLVHDDSRPAAGAR